MSIKNYINHRWKAFREMDGFAKTGIVIIVLSFFGLGWFGYQLFTTGLKPTPEIDLQVSSRVGDYFGGVFGAIWGLAATLLFFSSLRMQRKELMMNREELKLQREELKLARIEYKRMADESEKQAEALQEQFRNSEIQKFQQGFYSLLDNYKYLQDKFFNSFIINYEYAAEFNDIYKNKKEGIYLFKGEERYDFGDDESRQSFEARYILPVRWYFDTLFSTIKYIDSCKQLDHSEKEFYYNIFHSRISEKEKDYIQHIYKNQIPHYLFVKYERIYLLIKEFNK